MSIKYKHTEPLNVIFNTLEEENNIDLFKRGTKDSAGIDLRAVKKVKEYGKCIMYDTCIAVQIPKGYVGMLFGRSSLHKSGYMLANNVGVIDSDYRDSIKIVLYKFDDSISKEIGDKERIAQLVIQPVAMLKPTLVLGFDETEDIEREGGFGSTGL